MRKYTCFTLILLVSLLLTACTCSHKNATLIVQTSPTCSTPGITTYLCSDCKTLWSDYEYLPHNTVTAVHNPTCNEEGYTATYCTNCDYIQTYDFCAPTTHSYQQTYVSPTCQSDGYIRVACKWCQLILSSEIISAASHELILLSGEIVCRLCSYVYRSSCAHSFSLTNRSLPTCTENGCDYLVCSKCQLACFANIIPANGHSFGPSSTVASTCSAPSITTKACRDCGFIESEFSAPKPHNFTNDICLDCQSMRRELVINNSTVLSPTVNTAYYFLPSKDSEIRLSYDSELNPNLQILLFDLDSGNQIPLFLVTAASTFELAFTIYARSTYVLCVTPPQSPITVTFR